MNDFQQAINRLKSSPRYQKLATYKPPFDPFGVMGVLYRERSHSKVLGWLLSDEANEEFRQKFVSWIVNRLDNYNPNVGAVWSVDVRFEHGDNEAGCIDVFAHFPDIKLAVAIEVKVWAGEQDSQIGRYQCFLNRKCPNCMKAVIFLTPSGEASKTEDPGTGVPVLNISWDEIARIIDNMRPEQGKENDFRVQFRSHLRRKIVMNEKEEKRIVRDLLCEGDNARILQRIMDNMPSLGDFSQQQQWKEIVAEVCKVEEPNSLELSMHPTRGAAQSELKIIVPEWRDAGLPFTLMLHTYRGGSVRILLHKEVFENENNRVTLEKFAASSNGVINHEFPRLGGWTDWHSVLNENVATWHTPETDIHAEIYDDKAWKKEVKENLDNQIRELLGLIEKWLAKKSG